MKKGSSLKGKVLRAIALVVVAVFVGTQAPVGFAGAVKKVSAAVSLTPDQIAIPENMGSVVRTHQGSNGKLVINIQDLHCNYDAQKSHAAILDVVTQKGVKLVQNEGKWTDTDFQYTRLIFSPSVRNKGGEKCLQEGIINGTEYFEISGEADMLRPAVEDQALYKQGAQYYFDMRPLRGRAYRTVRDINKGIDTLKASLYSQEMKDFDAKRAAYKKGELNTSDYYTFLSSVVSNIETKYPNAAKVAKLVTLEKSIDFAKVNSEREEAITALNKVLNKAGQDKLAQLGILYAQGKVTNAEYYMHLMNLIKSEKITQETKNLSIYTEYTTLYEGINFSDLSREQDKLERQAGLTLCKTQDQKDLYVIAERMAILASVVDLKVTRDEYTIFAKDHDVRGWVATLQKIAQNSKASVSFSSDLAVLEQLFPVAIGFYETANKRDEAFVNNLIHNMDKANENVSVLVTGGFHTDRVTEMLKEKGYSFVVVSPKINTIGNDDLYQKRMAATWQAIGGMQSPTAATNIDDTTQQVVNALTEIAITSGAQAGGAQIQNGAIQYDASRTNVQIAADLCHELDELQGQLQAIVGTGQQTQLSADDPGRHSSAIDPATITDLATANQLLQQKVAAVQRLYTQIQSQHGLNASIVNSMLVHARSDFGKTQTERAAYSNMQNPNSIWAFLGQQIIQAHQAQQTAKKQADPNAQVEQPLTVAQAENKIKDIATAGNTLAQNSLARITTATGVFSPANVQNEWTLLLTENAAINDPAAAEKVPANMRIEVAKTLPEVKNRLQTYQQRVIVVLGPVETSAQAKAAGIQGQTSNSIYIIDQSTIVTTLTIGTGTLSNKPEEWAGLPIPMLLDCLARNMQQCSQDGYLVIQVAMITATADITLDQITNYLKQKRNA